MIRTRERNWSRSIIVLGAAGAIVALLLTSLDSDRQAPVVLLGLVAVPFMFTLGGAIHVAPMTCGIARVVYRKPRYVYSLSDQEHNAAVGPQLVLKAAILPALIFTATGAQLGLALFEGTSPRVVVSLIGLSGMIGFVLGGFLCAIVPAFWAFDLARIRHTDPHTLIPERVPLWRGVTLAAFLERVSQLASRSSAPVSLGMG